MIFKDQTEAPLDSRSKINAISQVFASHLGVKVRQTNVRAQKIDGTTSETHGMLVFNFSMSDKDDTERLFEECFF